MQAFKNIIAKAESRKGEEAIAEMLQSPLSAEELTEIPAERWLSMMTKCIFQAGFSWKVVENKWPNFEKAFDGFDLGRCIFLHEEEIEEIAASKTVIANFTKLRSVPENARYLGDIEKEYGSVGAYFASWKPEDYCANLTTMRKASSRLGGRTGQIFLRRMGVDAMIFSNDVSAALIREGIVAKEPSSQKDLKAVQGAINKWQDETGLPLNHISQYLAFSAD